jgi:hypothetical protein
MLAPYYLTLCVMSSSANMILWLQLKASKTLDKYPERWLSEVILIELTMKAHIGHLLGTDAALQQQNVVVLYCSTSLRKSLQFCKQD